MNKILTTVCTLSLLVLGGQGAKACTSAIIGAEMNPYGRPILWKHRDTDKTDNKVEYVKGKDGSYSYVALYNADDKQLREAWMGMNERGFAIMNTASYNLKDDKVSGKMMDKEGILMSKALKSCRTVDDFARFLETYPRPMGVEANFGVIDALGNGAYFETNNHSYKRFDLKDAPNHVLVRTNYSKSGRPNEGFGFARETSACELLAPYIASKSVTPEVLTEEVSRSFYHGLINRDFSRTGDRWVVDQDFIPRFKSTSTVAIEGCIPVGDIGEVTPEFVAREFVMWTGLGYPPVSEIRAVYCTKDGVDSELRGSLPNGHSPLGDEAKKRRSEVFPLTYGNGEKYIDMEKLYNAAGTGYAQIMKRKNLEYYNRVRGSRGGK